VDLEVAVGRVNRRLASPEVLGRGLPTRDEAGAPLIRLQTLGACVVLVGEQRVTPAAGTNFALLIRLAYAPGMQLSRDLLCETLWPEQATLRQRGNLRQALYKLRMDGVRVEMDGQVVLLDGLQVLPTFACTRDPSQFERDALESDDPFGHFLPDYRTPWPRHEQWLEDERNKVHAEVRQILSRHLRLKREALDWPSAQRAASWMIHFDILNEEATLTLAECAALSGAKVEALAILDRYISEIGGSSPDVRLPASILRRRIAEPSNNQHSNFAFTERHFLGRETDLATLARHLRRARWNEGCSILIGGPVGIGKTRLGLELAKLATLEGFHVLSFHARDGESLANLRIVRDLAPLLAERSGALGASRSSLEALQLTPADASPCVAGEGTSSRSQLGIERESSPTLEELIFAFNDLLFAVSAERPTLLLVDNAHLLDQRSWRLIEATAERAERERLLLVLFASEELDASAPLELFRPHIQRVKLAPIAHAICRSLAHLILSDLSATADDQTLDQFSRAAQGNPLLLRSIVHHFAETGEVDKIPPNARGVIARRVFKLSQDSKAILQAATLLDRWATSERVTAILTMSMSSMLAGLDELERRECVGVDEVGGLLVPTLVRACVLEQLTPAVAHYLHSRACEVLELEAQNSRNDDLLLPALIHARESGNRSLLMKFASRAGYTLDAVSSPTSVLESLSAIRTERLGLFATPLRTLETRIRVESGLYRTILSEFGARASDSDEDIGVPTPLNVEDELAKIEAEYRGESTVTSKDDLVMRALGIAEAAQLDVEIRGRAASAALVIATNLCHSGLIERSWRTAQEIAETLSPDLQESRLKVLYHTVAGDLQVALAHAKTLYRRAQRNPESLTSAGDAIRAGFSLRIAGIGDEYHNAFILAERISRSLGLPMHRAHATWQLSADALDSGDSISAEHWQNQMLSACEDVSDKVATSFAPALCARVALECRDLKRARVELTAFERALEATPAIRARAHLLALSTAINFLAARKAPSLQESEELEGLLYAVGSYGQSDFLAATTIESMRFHSGPRASELSVLYMSKLRRERRPAPKRLRRAIESCDV
jgi:DNA-binding SARP family transcriptional activator